MHVRFMLRAFSHDKFLLINDCIYFILYDVLFYAVLDYVCRDVNVNVSLVTCPVLIFICFQCDLYIKCH